MSAGGIWSLEEDRNEFKVKFCELLIFRENYYKG